MKAIRTFKYKALLFLSLLLLLSACGGTAGSNTGSPTSSSLPTATNSSNTEVTTTEDSASSTTLFTDFQGRETEIPNAPKRVVTVAGSGATIDLLELGFESIGYPYRYMEDSSILVNTREQLKKKAIDIGMPTNLEAVLSLDPDLIVLGYETQDGEYDMLQKIAPVVAFDESLPFQDRLIAISEIVGKQSEAEAIIADINGQIDDMWNKVRAEGKIAEGETAAVIVYYWDQSMYLMKNFGVFDLINHPSGMGMSPEVEALTTTSSFPYIELSEEAILDNVVSDHLFLIYDNNEAAQEGFKTLSQSTFFKNLPQVKNGKAHYIPIEYNDSDVVTIRKLIEDFPSLLGKNVFE